MEKMRDKNGKPEKKSSRTTLIMAAGLLGILLIGIAPMLKTDGAKKQFQQETVPSAEEYAAALESRLEELGTNTQQEMVYIQDYMGQYNSYLQGANTQIANSNQTLTNLARGQ